MRKLTDLFIDRPFITTLVTVFLIVLGLFSLKNIPIEATPHVEVPFCLIRVPYPGAAAVEVESQVLDPLDEELSTLEDIDYYQVIARENLAFGFVRFLDDADFAETLADTKDAVDRAKAEFPDDVEEPQVFQINFDDLPIIQVSLTGEEDLFLLKEIAEDMKDQILNVPGVESIDIFGGLDREVQVDVDPLQLRAYGLSLGQVAQAVGAQNVNLPGGNLQIGQTEYLVRTLGEFETVDEIADAVVGSDGTRPVLLREVARVFDTHEKRVNYSRLNGEEAVTLIIRRKSGINTIETVDNILKRVEELKDSLPAHIHVAYTADQTDIINRMITQLGDNAKYGFVFVVLVLLIGMGLRNSLLVAAVIPFCLLFAITCLFLFGMEISNVAIFALILILGIVVDGAIIVAENIYAKLEQGVPRLEASREGVHEVGGAVLSAHVTTIAAFAPMMFMVGIMGQFMSVLPKVVAFSLTASIIADHFIVPVIASKVMKVAHLRNGAVERRGSAARQAVTGAWGVLSGTLNGLRRGVLWLLSPFAWAYGHTIRFVITNRLVTIAISLAMLIGCAAYIAYAFNHPDPEKRMKVVFFPQVDNGRFSINIHTPPGTDIETTYETVAQVERELELDELPEMDHYVSTIGQTDALNADNRERGKSGREHGKIAIEIGDPHERKLAGLRPLFEVVEELRARLGQRADFSWDIFILREGPPTGAPVVIRVYGKNWDLMYDTALEVERQLKLIVGVTDVRVDFEPGNPEIRVHVDRKKAATQYGLTSGEIARNVFTGFFGFEATDVQIGDERVDVRVQLDEAGRQDLSALQNLTLQGRQGQLVPLSEVADVSLAGGIKEIIHRNSRRLVSVEAEIDQRLISAPGVHQQLREKMRESALPPGVELEYSGETEERDRSFASLGGAFGIALLLIFFILTGQFNSFLQPVMVMAAIPMSLVGVILGLRVAGLDIGFIAMLGFVALTGVVVNDSIVLIDYINQQRRKGVPLMVACRDAGIRRFRPVSMTSVTTIVGLLPLVLNLGGGGAFWRPLGVSMIGGLAVATFLTLIFVPVTYSIVEQAKAYALALIAGRPLPEWSSFWGGEASEVEEPDHNQ